MVAFMAIDSRVVVASIDNEFGDVLRDAHISGWEYPDKIVQLPFRYPRRRRPSCSASWPVASMRAAPSPSVAERARARDQPRKACTTHEDNDDVELGALRSVSDTDNDAEEGEKGGGCR